jgi:hypothetical protein
VNAHTSKRGTETLCQPNEQAVAKELKLLHAGARGSARATYSIASAGGAIVGLDTRSYAERQFD